MDLGNSSIICLQWRPFIKPVCEATHQVIGIDFGIASQSADGNRGYQHRNRLHILTHQCNTGLGLIVTIMAYKLAECHQPFMGRFVTYGFGAYLVNQGMEDGRHRLATQLAVSLARTAAED